MKPTKHPTNSGTEPGDLLFAIALLLLPALTGVGSVALLALWAAQGIAG